MHILDRKSLKRLKSMQMWPELKQGWGITLDEENRVLYASDGSDKITKINADTLEVIEQLTVTGKGGKPQKMINELQFIYGYIWANVFLTKKIVKIDPSTGQIL